MEDKEVIKVLQEMLERPDLHAREQEALRDAIGLLSWTKLIEGWKDRKKRARDRKFNEEL